MRFQFQYRLGREDFIALNRMLNQGGYSKHRKPVRALFTLLGMVFGGIGVLYLQNGRYPAGAFLLLLGLFCIYRAFTLGSLSKRQADRLAAGVTGERSVTLDADGIHIRDSGPEALAPYEGVEALLYLDQRYFLVFDRRRILLLPLQAMTQGEPEALRTFLETQTGCDLQSLI